MKFPLFAKLVEESWSKAVAHASNNFEYYREELIKSLSSKNPEVRSAAVTSFNEANDPTVHDLVIKLIDDKDSRVRQEVLEYLEDFGKKEDIQIIFDRICEDIEHIYHKTAILQNLTGRDKGTILDDDSKEDIEKEINAWKNYLRLSSYI